MTGKTQTTPSVTPEEFRNAMSSLAGAVHIVTTNGLAGQRGVTVSACCSLSDNPPTLLVCLMRGREKNRIFIDNKKFCVNTLSGHHQPLADIFAGRSAVDENERFDYGTWSALKTGSSVLQDALIAFDCTLTHWYEHSTHYVLIGTVEALQAGQEKAKQEKDALIYLKRAYHSVVF